MILVSLRLFLFGKSLCTFLHLFFSFCFFQARLPCRWYTVVFISSRIITVSKIFLSELITSSFIIVRDKFGLLSSYIMFILLFPLLLCFCIMLCGFLPNLHLRKFMCIVIFSALPT